jgi:hypothetical protein
MDPTDDGNDLRDAYERTRADLVSLRAALRATHAKLEYLALLLRLEEARKADRAGDRPVP